MTHNDEGIYLKFVLYRPFPERGRFTGLRALMGLQAYSLH